MNNPFRSTFSRIFFSRLSAGTAVKSTSTGVRSTAAASIVAVSEEPTSVNVGPCVEGGTVWMRSPIKTDLFLLQPIP